MLVASIIIESVYGSFKNKKYTLILKSYFCLRPLLYFLSIFISKAFDITVFNGGDFKTNKKRHI